MPESQQTFVAGTRWLPFRNDSGYDLDPHSIVMVSDDVEFGGEVVFKAVRNDLDHRHPVGFKALATTSAHPVKNGKYGSLTFDWPALARYTGTAPTAGKLCGVANASFQIANSYAGFIAAGSARATGNGQNVILVRPCSQVLKGKTNAAITSVPGDVAVNVWTGTGNGSATSPSVQIAAVRDFFGNIDSTKYTAVAWDGDQWINVAAECPT